VAARRPQVAADEIAAVDRAVGGGGGPPPPPPPPPLAPPRPPRGGAPAPPPPPTAATTSRATRFARAWSSIRRSASIPTASAAPVSAPHGPPLQAIPPLRATAGDASIGSSSPYAPFSTMRVVSAQPNGWRSSR
jgi:hypothetical protein